MYDRLDLEEYGKTSIEFYRILTMLDPGGGSRYSGPQIFVIVIASHLFGNNFFYIGRHELEITC